MKNIIKKINVLGLMGLLVSGGIALAFSNANLTPDHYMDPIDNEWKELVLAPGNKNQPGTYRCDAEELSTCTGVFNPSTQEIEALDPGIYIEN